MPRNKAQNEKVRDERREQILTAALGLFAGKGFSATRTTDITEKTGISQGLIYHYFPSKEAIFTELIGKGLTNLNEAALNLEKLTIPADKKIRLAVLGLLEGLNREPAAVNYYFLMTQTALSESFPFEAREIIRNGNDLKYQVMARIFRQGQLEGAVRPVPAEELATLLFSLVNGLALNKAYYREQFRLPAMESVLHMFLMNP